ncbi:histidine phosphatase family protein [Mobilicoccus pelagius]|uniref:Phosphoglycerate mutase family protein n=1 Tax=Mobilicoccus pelagius NBRC 104925 TaxID=1089455 RepID=H5UW73_9MICO|nr:histidine phosphatase family protein [Mobilicoccus pelagius]GAB49981.1 phosphoglycerate mutase family protein [Mobilicoccus pelagius NBRC 104925]
MSDISAGHRRCPSQLVLVRHGESAGNVADRLAREKGSGVLQIDTRDADTPLSENGRRQAAGMGRVLAELAEEERPGIVLASPYRRALETARIALAESPLVDEIVVDERLRERDLGIFDGLTGLGIREKFPEEAERRGREGKFYYRPPGGESWTDVALRVRSVLGDIRSEYDGERVWVFSHQAVIMSFRFVIESLDEETLLGIDTDTPMANCSRTIYHRGETGGLELSTYADTRASDLADAPRTHEAPKHAGDHDV